MIKLTKFLIACDIPLNLGDYKVHLATGSEYPPIEAFYEGKFKEWQEDQARRNFQCGMVIGLIELRKHKWLFGGVYRIFGYEKRGGRIRYSTELIENQEDFIGRVIVHHERKYRQPYLNGRPDGGEFYVSEITEKKLSVQDFPGYNSILIDFRILNVIIGNQIDSWRGALSNIKGVYLITDTFSGKLYVGKADGEGGIWQRWTAYSKDGHGGNMELRELLGKNDPDYKYNYQYSILEIADSHASNEYIQERETHWKKVLRSREFGLNAN